MQTTRKTRKTHKHEPQKGFLRKWHQAVLTGLILMTPMMASAKMSDWFKNVGGEVSIISSVLVAILGAAGVVLVGFGIMSAISAKKNRQPMEHQPWLIVGGVLCVLLIPLVAGLGESISGNQDAKTSIDGLLNSNG